MARVVIQAYFRDAVDAFIEANAFQAFKLERFIGSAEAVELFNYFGMAIAS